MKSFKRLDYLALSALITLVVTVHFTSVFLGHLLDVNASLIYVLIMMPILVLAYKGYPQRMIRRLDRRIERHQAAKEAH